MRNFTEGPELKQIAAFALPMVIGGFFQQLNFFADGIIVGQLLGKDALSAVGAAAQIIFLLISLAVGISTGATILIAQFFGAKNFLMVNKAIDTNNLFLLGASILLGAAGMLGCHAVFVATDLPGSIMPMAESYLFVYLVGLPGLFGYYAMSAVLRGLGDSKTPLIVMIISSIVNIILNYVFISGMGMGVEGSALATVIAQGGTFVGLAAYLNRVHPLIRVRPLAMRFDWPIFVRSFQMGIPSGLQQAFVGAGAIAMQYLVNGYGDTTLIAAFTAVGRIDMLATLPAMNLGIALTSFVGQNIGAGKIGRVQAGTRITALLATGSSVLITGLILLLAYPLMHLFSTDPLVVEEGVRYLYIVSPFYFSFGLLFTFNGTLRGAGDTLIPMLITLTALWAVRIPLAGVFSRWWGPAGLWWAIPAGWAFGMFFSFGYYRLGRWKTKQDRLLRAAKQGV